MLTKSAQAHFVCVVRDLHASLRDLLSPTSVSLRLSEAGDVALRQAQRDVFSPTGVSLSLSKAGR